MLAKPIAEGTGKGVTPKSVVRSKADLAQVAVELLDRYQQPVLVETFLPGREFTVGIVGTGKPHARSARSKSCCAATPNRRCTRTPTRKSARRWSSTGTSRRADPLVAEAERIALEAWIALDCRDGGRVDIRCDASRQSDVPRGQSARGSASDAFRSADDRHRDRHAVRGADPRHRRVGRYANSEGARARRLIDRTSRMNVLLLHDAVSPTARPDAQDTLVQAAAVRAALTELGYTPEVIAVGDDLGALDKRLDRVATGSRLQPRRIARRVPMRPPLPFRPCSTATASVHRIARGEHRAVERQVRREGLHDAPVVADAGMGRRSTAAVRAFRSDHYIVKARFEHASRDLEDDAIVRCDSLEAARNAVRERTRALGRPCFAERFIRGREFNLSVLSGPAEPEVLSPAEIDFSAFPAGKAHMVGYRAKWVEDSFEFANTPRRFEFAASDAKLLAQLEGLARDHVPGNGIVGLRARRLPRRRRRSVDTRSEHQPLHLSRTPASQRPSHTAASAIATPSPGSSTPPSPTVEPMTSAASVPALAHGGNRNKDAPLLLLRLE